MAIQIADNFSYLGTKPLDARVKYATVADMKAVADSSLYDGCMAYVTGVKKYYTYDSSNTVDTTTGKWREYKSGSGHTVEDASGTAMAEQPNLQFKGLNVTNDTTNNATVVDGSGKALSTAIAPVFDDTETYAEGDRVMYGDELYVFNTAHTGAWAAADADKSDVDTEMPEKLTAAQMATIKAAFTPNTGAPLRMMNYSTDEQVVGTWIDGKPLYQKTYAKTMPIWSSGTGILFISEAASNDYETMVDFSGVIQIGQNDYAKINGYIGSASGTDIMWFGEHNGSKGLVVASSITNRSGKTVYVTVQYTKTTD